MMEKNRLVGVVIILLCVFLFPSLTFAEIVTPKTTEQTRSSSLKLWVPGAEPAGIFPNVLTDVKFGVHITGATSLPDIVQLEEVGSGGNPIRMVGNLKGDGRGGDLLPNDYVYSGTFPIKSEKEGTLYYRATAKYGGQAYRSEVCKVTVTNFPIGSAPSNPDFLVTDSKTGQKFYSNEVLVGFMDGVSPERMREIISAEKTLVVSVIPGIGVFQLHIPNKGTPEGVYETIRTFQAYEEVRYAEPNYVVELDEQ